MTKDIKVNNQTLINHYLANNNLFFIISQY